jgi:hypothetical protein
MKEVPLLMEEECPAQECLVEDLKEEVRMAVETRQVSPEERMAEDSLRESPEERTAEDSQMESPEERKAVGWPTDLEDSMAMVASWAVEGRPTLTLVEEESH